MTDEKRIDKIEQQMMRLKERNRRIFEILESQRVKPEEPAKRPSFEDHFKLKRR